MFKILRDSTLVRPLQIYSGTSFRLLLLNAS
jgi:hypothetical protein